MANTLSDKQYPSFGSSHVVQPRHSEDLSAREIEARRIKILESNKFSQWLAGRLENRTLHGNGNGELETFTTAEIGIIGYYIGMCDKDGLYRYLKELLGKEIESVVTKLEE